MYMIRIVNDQRLLGPLRWLSFPGYSCQATAGYRIALILAFEAQKIIRLGNRSAENGVKLIALLLETIGERLAVRRMRLPDAIEVKPLVRG